MSDDSTHSDTGGAAFQLDAGPYRDGELHVLSFEGHEEMNGLYRFEVLLWVRGLEESAFASSVLGRPTTLLLQPGQDDDQPRRGIVSKVVNVGTRESERATFQVTLVPRLFLLTKRSTTRIFQDRTVRQIVDAILDERGVERSWLLLSTGEGRTYCVQYNESDYDFITRILAEEGIFFWFEHPPDTATERLVLADAASTYSAIAGDVHLAYRPQQGDTAMPTAEHHVLDFREHLQIEPNAVVTHDHDFLRPKLDLTAGASAEGDATPLEVYAHHRGDEGSDATPDKARVLLEQLRRGARESLGVSACRRLAPGRWFALIDHEIGALDSQYTVSRVEHLGATAEAARPGKRRYENRFRGAPREVPLRPARPRRALQQVTESAIVVGPEGQEIYTDTYGRVKVQFHWDRDGRRNEHSSCWMRVMQPWAGAGFGAQFIPRIGMEVVVTFLGGDVDRPVVLGSLYNAENLPPHRLTEKKAQSGIRTQSTPGGGGFNEIMFDDSAGGELLSLRAQRNLEEAAANDLRSTAGRDHLIAVGRRASRAVEGDDALHVKGSQTVRIDGGFVGQIAGSATSVCTGDRLARVTGNDTVEAAGGHTLQAATFSHVLIGHGNDEGGHGFVLVNGNYRIAAAGELQLSAQDSIRLTCGESEILLTPKGVKITSPSVEIAVSEKLTCTGKDNTISVGDHLEIKGDLVKIFGKTSSLLLQDDAELKGAKVKLNVGAKKPDDDKAKEDPELGDVVFHLDPRFDPGGKGPLTAIIATPSGEVIEKVADGNNEVRVQGRKGDHFVLLGVKCGETTLAKKPA